MQCSIAATGVTHHIEACAQVKHAQSGCGCGGLVVAQRWQAGVVACEAETCIPACQISISATLQTCCTYSSAHCKTLKKMHSDSLACASSYRQPRFTGVHMCLHRPSQEQVLDDLLQSFQCLLRWLRCWARPVRAGVVVLLGVTLWA